MTRKTPARIKCNPAAGRMPVLQHVPIEELQIDHTYQREISTGPSQTLIHRMARDWDWSIYQPLAVAQRVWALDALFVIDGQHRLAAARLRRDIAQLPCVIVRSGSIEEEAEMFRKMNASRQPLTKLDLFKAALAGGDNTARVISAAIAAASLKLAPHTNNASWGAGVIGNIGGLTKAWRTPGPTATSLALYVLGAAYRGQPLRQSGTLFPGILAIVADELKKNAGLTVESEEVDMLTEMVGETSQDDWLRQIMRHRADNPGVQFEAAAQRIYRTAWAELMAEFMDEAA